MAGYIVAVEFHRIFDVIPNAGDSAFWSGLVPPSGLCSWQAIILDGLLKCPVGFRNNFPKPHAKFDGVLFEWTLIRVVLHLLKTSFTRYHILTLSLLGANWARTRLEGDCPQYLFQPGGTRWDGSSRQSTVMCLTFIMYPVYINVPCTDYVSKRKKTFIKYKVLLLIYQYRSLLGRLSCPFLIHFILNYSFSPSPIKNVCLWSAVDSFEVHKHTFKACTKWLPKYNKFHRH